MTRDTDLLPLLERRSYDAVLEALMQRYGQKALNLSFSMVRDTNLAEDLAQVIDEQFFEVWNGVDGDNDPGDALRPSTDDLWDIANTLRIASFNAPPLYAVATDDSHDFQGNKSRALPGRAWIVVRASHLTPESLIRAMEAGDFYASTGVALRDVRFDSRARRLELRIEGHGTERYVTRFIGTRRGVNLVGHSRRDSSGKPIEATLDYTATGSPRRPHSAMKFGQSSSSTNATAFGRVASKNRRTQREKSSG